MENRDRLLGALLGVALGDAAGLPFEGLSRARIARRFRGLDRFQLMGRTGFVSDDTEQTALVLQALVRGKEDDAECVRSFRRSMIGWFARLPFGIGGATLRSCVRMMLGFAHPGVSSAGNGAAMRAGVLGVCLSDAPDRRRRLGRALARLTHTDERAVDGALYVAELAALCARSDGRDRAKLVAAASDVAGDPEVRAAIDDALATVAQPLASAAERLGTSGFVVHSVGICTYCFLRFGDDLVSGIEGSIRAGGDTDTHAAIVGGWLGALHGTTAVPRSLVPRIHDGPFGPSHLEQLASAFARGTPAPPWSWTRALLRNLALFPVVLAHGFARLVPW